MDSSTKRPAEIRLIAPIVIVWLVAFTLTIHLAARSASTDQDGHRWAGYFTVTAAGVGVLMTLVWTSFYGRLTIGRFATGLLLIVAASYFGPWLYRAMGGRLHPHALPYLPQGPAFVWLVGTVPLWAVRRIWNWRILPDDETAAADVRQFSLRQAFVWITFSAVVFTMAQTVLPENSNFTFFLFVSAIGIPCAAILFFLALLCRIRIKYLWPCVVLVAPPFVAAAYSIVFVASDFAANLVSEFAVERVFVPVWICSSIAGCALLAAATYLRWQGMLFRCGGCAGFGAPRSKQSARRWLLHPKYATGAVMVGAVCLFTVIALRPSPVDLDDLRRVAASPTVDDIPMLLEELKKESRATTAEGALVRIGPAAVPPLMKLLESKETQYRAIRTIGAIASSLEEDDAALEEAIPALERLMFEDKHYAAEAAEALGSIKNGRAVVVLIEALSSSDKLAAEAAAGGLFRRDPPAREAFPVLLEHFQSGHFGVDNRGAADVLAKTGGADAVPILLELLRALNESEDNGPTNDRGRSFAWSLVYIGSDATAAIPALLAALKSDHESLQLAGICGLRSIGPAAKEALRRMQELMELRLARVKADPSISVYNTLSPVLAAIEEIGGVTAVAGLRAVLLDESTPPEAKAMVADTLSWIGPGSYAFFSLSDCFQILEENEWRYHLLDYTESVLGQIEVSQEDIPALEAGLDSNSKEVREHSARLLGEMRDARC